jgi:hypothetical protein
MTHETNLTTGRRRDLFLPPCPCEERTYESMKKHIGQGVLRIQRKKGSLQRLRGSFIEIVHDQDREQPSCMISFFNVENQIEALCTNPLRRMRKFG